MAILYSYPETLELLPTDMLIGTSTIRVAGKKKNITKNFTLELLKNFILDGVTNVQWGTITGTLSNQTDLQAALNAKQNNITLTTTGSTGPATLVGATLNVPDYSTGMAVPTLNQVLTAGNTSLLDAKVNRIGVYDSTELAYGYLSISDSEFLLSDSFGTTSVITRSSITFLGPIGGFYGSILLPAVTANRTYTLPNATGTLALTSDIGTWGALNYPTWTAGTPFVKMTAAGTFALDTNTYLTSAVTSVTATSPITSSGGNTPIISTSMATNKLIGRSTVGTGVMEEIAIGTGLSLSAGTLNATATSPLTTKGDLYTFNTDNTRLPVGLDTQVLLADSSTATGLKWGTNTAATPTGYYGAWQDNVTQTAAASNTGYAMIFRTIDLANGISVVTNGTNLTRITFANTGVYNLQFSSQFQNLSNSPQDVTIWLRLNGVDVSGSSGVIGLEARKNPGDPYHIVSGWNYLLNVVAGQYYELVWSTTDHTNVTMHYYSAGSPPPSAASVILTVTQQSGIMAGTGITAINSLTGAAQTLTTGTTGTDFAIVDSGVDHKFNLPTASATNRGALSSTDWTTFNGKYNLPSLTSGSVLFSNGTTIAQDNANFFWDNTNKRFNIGGITSNTARFGIKAPGALSTDIALRVRNSADTADLATIAGNGDFTIGNTNPSIPLKIGINNPVENIVRLGISYDSIRSVRGGISWQDNTAQITSRIHTEFDGTMISMVFGSMYNGTYNSNNLMIIRGNGNVGIGTITPVAKLQIDSTTQGFLPPRMTTTQKNAIATPASGLVVYDTTLGKLCVRGASAWETITSI